MAQIKITIPGFGINESDVPIVILGPNGSGKTQLAQVLVKKNKVSAISAQRRTWVDDNLPVQEEQNLKRHIRNQLAQWEDNAWQPTEEINFLLSSLIQEHSNVLTKKNEEANESGKPFDPVVDTKLIILQRMWGRLFPKRKLEIGGFFPTVKRLDATPPVQPYLLRQMSDGERTVLYMAARVLTAEQSIILIDEPELHMHSKLSVLFWDEAERLRPDCRFVYITHDLNFTMSRRRALVLITRSPNEALNVVLPDDLPSSIVAEVLGAATLPFYAKRIFLFEGEPGKGFASEFFAAWFDDDETFAIPAGNCNSVCASVAGLKKVGVVAAEIIGLVDRDFNSDAMLTEITKGVTVLPLHEIESVLCDKQVIACISEHLRKDPDSIWNDFLGRVRKEFCCKTVNNVIAQRVRSRIGDLLDGAYKGELVVADIKETSINHSSKLTELDLPSKIIAIFEEESGRVNNAISDGGIEMLAILPGKHLLSLLSGVFGFSNQSELIGLVVRSLNRKQFKKGDPILLFGEKLEASLQQYLPSRRA